MDTKNRLLVTVEEINKAQTVHAESLEKLRSRLSFLSVDREIAVSDKEAKANKETAVESELSYALNSILVSQRDLTELVEVISGQLDF